MSTVKFLKNTYAIKAVRDVPNAVILDSLSTPQLATLFSEVASNLGKKGVNRFADKESAVRRTWAVLCEYEGTDVTGDTAKKAAPKKAEAPAAAATPTATKVKKPGKKPFRFNFNFHPDPDGIKAHREGSKGRAVAIQLLSQKDKDGNVVGATFEEVMKGTGWDEKKAYEGIRLVHFALGWGMKLDNDTGKIRIYKGAPKK